MTELQLSLHLPIYVVILCVIFRICDWCFILYSIIILLLVRKMESLVNESESALGSWEEMLKQTMNREVVNIKRKCAPRSDEVTSYNNVDKLSTNYNPMSVYRFMEVPNLLRGSDRADRHDVIPIRSSSSSYKSSVNSRYGGEFNINILSNPSKRRFSGYLEEKIPGSILEEFPRLSLVNLESSLDNQQHCIICKKSFKHDSHLKRHLNSHSKDKRYRCLNCGKCFMDTSTLARHTKIHSGDKPWSCNICCKTFGTLGSLRRHVTVHNQDGRLYTCSVCKKRFPDNSSLQKHIFIHSGIKPHFCGICKKSFVHVGDLNGHKKLHDGFKPFKCEQCSSEFSKHSNYIRHLSVHGEKTFTCNVCCVGYKFRNSLTKHLLTHTKRKKIVESKGLVTACSKQNFGTIT